MILNVYMWDVKCLRWLCLLGDKNRFMTLFSIAWILNSFSLISMYKIRESVNLYFIKMKYRNFEKNVPLEYHAVYSIYRLSDIWILWVIYLDIKSKLLHSMNSFNSFIFHINLFWKILLFGTLISRNIMIRLINIGVLFVIGVICVCVFW